MQYRQLLNLTLTNTLCDEFILLLDKEDKCYIYILYPSIFILANIDYENKQLNKAIIFLILNVLEESL